MLITLCVALMLGHPRHSGAETVQVGFTAVIGGIQDVGYLPDAISVGDTLIGYYTYDLDIPDSDPDPHRGFYELTSMPTSIVVYADSGWVFRTDGSNVLVRITIGDSLQWVGSPADAYNFTSHNNTGYSTQTGWNLPPDFIQFELLDRSLSALPDDGLPTAPPDLDAWPDRRVLFIAGEAFWMIGAEVITTSAVLPTGVGDRPPRVHGRLGPNVPNPFNPITTIPYSTERPARVTLAIYDVGGRVVRRLVNERLPAGDYETRWDGRDDAGRAVASGIYLYRLTADGYSSARKAVLVR